VKKNVILISIRRDYVRLVIDTIEARKKKLIAFAKKAWEGPLIVDW